MSEKCLDTGKRIYRSHDAVMRDCGSRFEPYMCRFCRYWHRTKTDAERRVARRMALVQMVHDGEAAGLYDLPEAPCQT